MVAVTNRRGQVVLPIILLMAILACNYNGGEGSQYPQTISDSKNLEFYSIEPTTLLQKLKKGNANILTLVLATPDPYPTPTPDNRLQMWTYQEYLTVVNATTKSTWPDGLDQWKLFRMYFIVDCQDPLIGFTIGDFYYFKEITESGKALYSGREILIRPLYADITIGSGSTYAKPPFGWRSINLDKMEIDSNSALLIAEKAGGEDFRASTKNNCDISSTFNPNSGYNGWKILYNSDNTDFFELHVNAQNGEYQIIK